jgi:hypothetical protein
MRLAVFTVLDSLQGGFGFDPRVYNPDSLSPEKLFV